jgi:superfamily II DNA/RNA helicase
VQNFADLGVPAPLVAALAARGIDSPFPVQTLTLPDALAGRDVAGKAKTGSGKTLAFGLAVLARTPAGGPRRPASLVLAPTRELATQIADELEPLADAVGRTVCAVYGGASSEKQIRRLKNGADVVVATPGRLIDLIQRGDALLDEVSIVVIDEADRMADMGFLPQVQWLLRHVPDGGQTLLFSATLDGATAVLARQMSEPVIHTVEESETTVSSMIHRFLQVHHMDKARVVAAIAGSAERTIVFCRTKRACDRVARDLRDLGVSVAAIHGDLPQQKREKALSRFIEGSLAVLVATDVAGRGIHVDGIDVVVHSDPPEDPKAYLHRSGRTARAGEAGLVVTLVEWNQELEVKRLQKRLGLERIPQVQMFSNDPRLADLAGWDPTAQVA